MTSPTAPLYQNLHDLFASVFWPAAAGNVFWAICTIVVDQKSGHWTEPDTLSRLVTLTALCAYLTVNWVRDFHRYQTVIARKGYWLAQAAHVITMVGVALSAHLKPSWLANASALFFAFNFLGHAGNVFGANDKGKSVRGEMALLHLGAAAACILSSYCAIAALVPFTYVVVLALWLALRWKEIHDLFSPNPISSS